LDFRAQPLGGGDGLQTRLGKAEAANKTAL
jgi:hypothetical protein